MKKIIYSLILCVIMLILTQCTVENKTNPNLNDKKNVDTIENSINTSESALSVFTSWIGHYKIGDRILYLCVDQNQNLIGRYNDGTDAEIEINKINNIVIIDGEYASYSSDTLFLELLSASTEIYNIYIKLDYQNVDYSMFNNDNISLTESINKQKDFTDYKDLISYSSYSGYKYKMNFNSLKVDNNRNWEPLNFVYNGYKRKYFENSERVYCQRKVVKGVAIEEIYFHPNGEIYTINQIYDGKRHGAVKFADLNKHVILQGHLSQGNIIGYWDNPIFGNFDIRDRKLNELYPGVINLIRVLVNFYDLTIDERNFYVNM